MLRDKLKKIAKDFLIAYVPYLIVAEIIGLLWGVEWYKTAVIVASMIAVNMFFNVLYTILSTFRFKVITDWLRNRKK